jgi:hypothetical protein
MILDGRNRYRACEAAGVEPRFIPGDGRLKGNRIEDPTAFVISTNIHRRHLTGAQKRDLIAALLKMRPETSNNAVAKQIKVDDKTVAKVRRELEATSEIPKLEKTVGTDGRGRKQPHKRTRRSKQRGRRSERETHEETLDHTVTEAEVRKWEAELGDGDAERAKGIWRLWNDSDDASRKDARRIAETWNAVSEAGRTLFSTMMGMGSSKKWIEPTNPEVPCPARNGCGVVAIEPRTEGDPWAGLDIPDYLRRDLPPKGVAA